MNCNNQVHEQLQNEGEPMSPFCDQLLAKVEKTDDPCCNKKEIETVNGAQTCINCGVVYCYDYKLEYFDFYDNLYRIKRKSIYQRKYHIENVLNSISCEKNFQLTFNHREQIYKAFNIIANVLQEVNVGLKRMISIKFILKQLLKFLGYQLDIQVTKSQKTLKFYKQNWDLVELSKGDQIKKILTD